MTPDEFMSAYMPYAERASEATGVDPRIIIGQAALESNWGRSGLARNYNNLFGIKSHGRSGGAEMATTEYGPGGAYRTTSSFRSYADPGESFMDYADFINRNPRYRDLREAGDYPSQLRALQASGYATDPGYARKVASVAQRMGSAAPQTTPTPRERPEATMQTPGDIMRGILQRGEAAQPAPAIPSPGDIMRGIMTRGQGTPTPATTPAFDPSTAVEASSAAPPSPQPAFDPTTAQEMPQGAPQEAAGASAASPPSQPTPAAQAVPAGNWADAVSGGANTLLGGVPNMVNAAIRQLTGNGAESYTDTLRALHAQQEAAAAAHPYMQAAGMALGAIPATVAAAAIPGAAAVTLPGRVATGAALGAATGAGTGFSDTGRLGGAVEGGLSGTLGGGIAGAVAPQIVPIAGAALGGLAGYKASGGDAAATVGGAVAGGAGARALGRVAAPAIRRLVGAPTGEQRTGFDQLAAIIRQPGESVADVARRVRADFDEFRQTFGVNPNAAQLLERQQARELAARFDSSPRAIEAAQQAEETTAQRMQAGLHVNIEGLHNPSTFAGLTSRGSREMTAAMDAQGAAGVPVRETPVPTAVNGVLDPVFEDDSLHLIRNALGRNSADARELEAAAEAGAPVPLRLIDLARSRVESVAAPGDQQNARTVAARLLEMGRDASSEYGRAFDQYVVTNRRAAGAQVGATGATEGPEQFRGAIARLEDASGRDAPFARAGVGPGLRTELAESATRGPAGGAATATRIAQNENVQRNLAETLPAAEAQRIRRTAEIAQKAGSAMSELAVAGKSDQEIGRQAADYAARAAAYGVLGHNFGMWHSVANLLRKTGLTRGAQLRLVEIATDPGQTPALVRYLEGRGLGRRDAIETVRRLVTIAAGGTAAQAAAP